MERHCPRRDQSVKTGNDSWPIDPDQDPDTRGQNASQDRFAKTNSPGPAHGLFAPAFFCGMSALSGTPEMRLSGLPLMTEAAPARGKGEYNCVLSFLLSAVPTGAVLFLFNSIEIDVPGERLISEFSHSLAPERRSGKFEQLG